MIHHGNDGSGSSGGGRRKEWNIGCQLATYDKNMTQHNFGLGCQCLINQLIVYVIDMFN